MQTDISVKILADSMNPMKHRLTTFELTYPRFIHAEIMTHRMFSRNSASSRAIPITKMHERIMNDPVIPKYWGTNQKGMQAGEPLSPAQIEEAKEAWLQARDYAVGQAKVLHDLGLHKQIVNRLTEPFMWITVILSTTSFDHFERLRVSDQAEPHFNELATKMLDARKNHQPQNLKNGEWHLPLLQSDDFNLPTDIKIKLCTARCARVSYLTHAGKRDPEADIALHDRLVGPGHWSPFEHVAKALDSHEWFGNFQGFLQYRKLFREEFVHETLEKP